MFTGRKITSYQEHSYSAYDSRSTGNRAMMLRGRALYDKWDWIANKIFGSIIDQWGSGGMSNAWAEISSTQGQSALYFMLRFTLVDVI